MAKPKKSSGKGVKKSISKKPSRDIRDIVKRIRESQKKTGSLSVRDTSVEPEQEEPYEPTRLEEEEGEPDEPEVEETGGAGPDKEPE